MFYTIGYQKRRLQDLIDDLEKWLIDIVIDVRSKPNSKNPTWRPDNLRDALGKRGIKYYYNGRKLGGFGKFNKEALEPYIKKIERDEINICFLCFESDHKTCHRYYKIGKLLNSRGHTVWHITPLGRLSRQK